MGGLTPGIGGSELIVIGLVALLVVGPKDLPLLMRRVGQALAKARAMANEFRASFDEMARQSELDDLRKEVEALRRGQGMLPLGAEAESTFRDIHADLNKPLLSTGTPPAAAVETSPETAPAEPVVTGVSEWPDTPPPASAPKPRKARAASPKSTAVAKTEAAKPRAASRKAPAASKPTAAKSAARKATARKPSTRKSAT